jgi:hypothetical protein
MFTIGKPYSPALADLEAAVTERRPGARELVDRTITSILTTYGPDLSEDERVCIGALRIVLLEAIDTSPSGTESQPHA